MGGINDLTELHTAREIRQQPEMWRDTRDRVIAQSTSWRDLLAEQICLTNTQVILSGAGTSFYAGLALQPMWRQLLQRPCEAWPTTRIVTEPETVISKQGTVLLVSLARSGNNPESIGSVKLVNQVASEAYHVAITCNQDSFLGQLERTSSNAKTLALHPATLDQGLAMTSSFTSLVIAGQVLAGAMSGSNDFHIIEGLARLAEGVVENSAAIMDITQSNDFDRVFVFGDGSQYAAALEGVLKFEEFSDGQIIGLAESFLGARHGYANVINDQTLAIFLLSENPYVRAYQMSVIVELHERRPNTTKVAITLHDDGQLHSLTDYVVVLDEQGDTVIPDVWRASLDTVVLQCLSLQAAVKLGVPPDNPFRHRATAKAIEGCKLIPYTHG